MTNNPKISHNLPVSVALDRIENYLAGKMKNFTLKRNGNKIEINNDSAYGVVIVNSGSVEVSGNFPEKHRKKIVSELTQILA